MEGVDITVYQGIWTPPLDLEDWLLPGDEVVGHWRLPASQPEEQARVDTGQGTILYALEPARLVRVHLDPAVVAVGGVTRLELRHSPNLRTAVSQEDCLGISGDDLISDPAECTLRGLRGPSCPS